MEYKIDYLLRYVSNDTFNKIKSEKNDYVLKLLQDNYIDTDLNIKYLIRYGISNIETVVYNWLEDLTINHNDFIKKIKDYENKLTKEEVIMLFENV